MSARCVRRLAVTALPLLAVLTILPVRAQDVLGTTGIRGAGSTFVYPILSRWSREYRTFLSRGGEFPSADGGLDDPPASSALEYEPVGSLGGTLRVKDRAVDFAASDMPLRSDELSSLALAQFPIVMGGVVVAVNIDGVKPGEMKLDGPLLADIFLKKKTVWSDPAIKALNPTLRLPDAEIVVVHRSDGSGTTFNFTDYLSKVSPDWRRTVGSGLLVPWPTGAGVKGNEGVAQTIRRLGNSIGYMEYTQAVQLNLSDTLIRNRAGRFVRPDRASFQAAASGADWQGTNDFYLVLTDVPGENAYPITATVFILMRKATPGARTRAALDFFRWSLDNGARTANQLGYVSLPPGLVEQVKNYWTKTFKL